MKLPELLTACLLALTALPSAAEPLELTRLRSQFEHRVEQQIVPLRRTYVAELEKLEQRFAKGGRLEDALAVKKERESTGTASTVDPAVSGGRIRTAEDLAKSLENSTWEYVTEVPPTSHLSYFILLPGGVMHCAWNNVSGTWKATDRNKVEFEIPSGQNKNTGTMKLSADLLKWEGTFSADGYARSGKRVVPKSAP